MNKEAFLKVLEEAANQVFSGKGEERHGHGTKFEEQPWKHITDNVGTGFVLGQALKKLMELRTFTAEEKLASWRREALGAIVYIVMAILYKDNEAKKVTK